MCVKRSLHSQLAFLGFGLAAAFYAIALPGLSGARRDPPEVEIAIATWLLRHSVPGRVKAERNLLGADEADVTAGQDLFREKCEICHGYDGGGRTQIGAGEYPHPPALRTLARSLADGEFFTTFATAFEIPECLPGTCQTGKSGNSSSIYGTYR